MSAETGRVFGGGSFHGDPDLKTAARRFSRPLGRVNARTGIATGARRPFLRSETVNLTRSAVNQPRYRQAADEKKKRKGKKENPMVSAGQAKFLPGIAVPSIVIRRAT
ncbi:uncharacterized protein LOC105428347 isoform X4 [Pogonomyrmex barbatus]|uniref:Uncharacterized protein LOC105428347 isoform X4 n=1 Tax=Pogonomyrmex barbatus TaxID=144034 RepID=A0A6I9WHY4_9HYME|nr:uncharacterized protein LOC105428347 isoform X4 [Pogonomyrmex barbatus]